MRVKTVTEHSNPDGYANVSLFSIDFPDNDIIDQYCRDFGLSESEFEDQYEISFDTVQQWSDK